MRRFARLLALAAPLVLAPVASSPLIGCGGGGGGGPAGPGVNACSRLFVGNGGFSVSIPNCFAVEDNTTNVVRDQFGRVTSANFDTRCTQGSSERVVGTVSNITYNNLGETLSWQATVNGRNCSFP